MRSSLCATDSDCEWKLQQPFITTKQFTRPEATLLVLVQRGTDRQRDARVHRVCDEPRQLLNGTHFEEASATLTRSFIISGGVVNV